MHLMSKWNTIMFYFAKAKVTKIYFYFLFMPVVILYVLTVIACEGFIHTEWIYLVLIKLI